MENTKEFYSTFEVDSKSSDEIFRSLCIDKKYKQLEDVTWKEAFVNLFGNMLEALPNPRTIAARIVNRGLVQKGLKEIDCENIYFNMFNSVIINEHHYNHDLLQSYRVTDACLMNIFATEYEFPSSMHHYDRNGIYSVGKDGTYGQYPDVDPAGTTALWGPNEEVYETYIIADIISEDPIWEEFVRDYNNFWAEYNDLYTDLLADTFLANAVNQYKAKTLSEEGFLMVRNAYYGKSENVQVTLLDIYGYASTDIICIEQKEVPTSRVILYIPGGYNSFVEFLNLDDLKQWIAWHLQTPSEIVAFRKHFSLRSRQDGTSYTGVDNVLNGIAEESSTWPANKYILYEPTSLNVSELFIQIKDKVKQRMFDDGDVQIKSSSEATRDYALSVVETLISQLSVIDMIVPEIGIPINIALSATALGLSSDIVVNGDSYEERKYGVGSLVTSAIFTAINLVPAILDSATILRNFARTPEELPVFLTEEQFIANHFGLTEEELTNILPGEQPRFPEGDNPQMRLVRLSNESSPLVILRKITGNKYVRLNPFTLEEMDSALINEVLDPETGSIHYISNGGLVGGSPYSPFRLGLEDVWTDEVLKKRAYVFGKPIGQSYTRILETLKRIHSNENIEMRQGLMHELMELIDEYEIVHPDSGRLPAFQELRKQLEDALYFPDSTQMTALKSHVLTLPNKGSGAAQFLLNTGMKEMSSQGEEITANLIRFAKADEAISAPFKGYAGEIPTEIAFPVKYAVKDISIFDELATNYFELPAYQELEITSNSQLLRYVLTESQNASLLKSCSIIDDSLYIGHSYEELSHSISEFANGEECIYPVHPRTFIAMLEEAKGDFGFTQMYATRDFFNTTVTSRLSLMENVIILSKDFDYANFDAQIGEAFSNQFAEAEGVADRIALCLTNYSGVVIDNSENSVNLFLENLSDFINNGLTDIAITDLQYDLAQTEIMRFLAEEGEWQQLDSMLLTLDQGRLDGPYRRLLMAAKDNDLRFTALGHADHSINPFEKDFQSIYFKGNTIMNSIEQLSNSDKKFIIFTDTRMINSTPGIDGPQPGLAQYLEVPGTITDSEGNWNFYPEIEDNRIAITVEELENWQKLSPEKGRILGLKQFRVKDGAFPTPAERKLILENSVPENLREELFQYIDQITHDEIMQSLVSSTTGSCDTVSRNVFQRLKEMQIETGKGATLTWWTREGGLDIGYDMHTTASFKLQGEEFVVDASHKQILHYELDDDIIILPINDWADEIARRVRAINPFLSYQYKGGNALAFFEPPLFTKPRLKRPQ